MSAFGLGGKIDMLNWRMLCKLCDFMNFMHKIVVEVEKTEFEKYQNWKSKEKSAK